MRPAEQSAPPSRRAGAPAKKTGLRALARAYPWTTRLIWGAALLLFGGDLLLVGKRMIYARETVRLRAGMSGVERARIDAALRSDSNRVQVIIELARRQARGDAGLHLSVAVDSGMLYLEQDGATLRAVRAEIGADAWMRTGARDSVRITAPRGTRTIAAVWDDTAVVLNGGALIYARPAAGAAPVRPGAVRVDPGDLKVLRPNLQAGQRVYFY